MGPGMQRSILLLLSLLWSLAYALLEVPVARRISHSSGSPSLLTRGATLHLQKRIVEADPFYIPSWVVGGGYYINVTVGTPPQEQTILFSTGSSDLYFDSSESETCQRPPEAPGSCRGGTFNSVDSSTYEQINASPAFNITYADGSVSAGPFGSDVIGIGDVTISGPSGNGAVQFGIAESISESPNYATGILGLGYRENQARAPFYNTLVDIMAQENTIASRVFSIALGQRCKWPASTVHGSKRL